MGLLYGILKLLAGALLLFFSIPMSLSTCRGIELNLQNIELLWSKGFFIVGALFVLPGLILVILGIRDIVKRHIINSEGIETYGVIVESKYNHVRSGKSYYTIYVLIINDDGTVGEYKEDRIDPYPIGGFWHVKYHDDNMHIMHRADEYEIPYHIRNVLGSSCAIYSHKQD